MSNASKYTSHVSLYLSQYDFNWPVYSGTLLDIGIMKACPLLGQTALGFFAGSVYCTAISSEYLRTCS